MINFFRKLRQQLLSQNKVSKYLLYAIGEIALVMIGILLALQVNNWNESKKQKNFANKILNAITISIKKNIVYYEFVIDYNEDGNQSAEIILNHLDKNLSYHDSLDIHFSHAIQYSTPIIRNAGYESLKSYGLSIIENDSILEALEVYNDGFVETLVLRQEYYFSNTVLPVLTELFETVAIRSDMKPFDYDELKNSRKYRSILNTSIANRNDQNKWYKIWLQSIKDIEKMIDEELQNQ